VKAQPLLRCLEGAVDLDDMRLAAQAGHDLFVPPLPAA
jgi:hypothetical protein